ncbi:MAG: helix-turn-helix transcriptional regulator [Saprospiraceae bacterium]|nr:helix-turn-helix transcriptional regulator [Saprospiraceae bacterium]
MLHFKSIGQLLEAFRAPKTRHPLFHLMSFDACELEQYQQLPVFTADLYFVFFKKIVEGQILYGHSRYDHTQGTLSFFKPRQAIEFQKTKCDERGFIIAFHEDFLLNTPLFDPIKRLGFFDYDVRESLHVSDAEKAVVWQHFDLMEAEYLAHEDEFSRELIVAQLQSLFVHAKRFYKRQFLHRQPLNSSLFARFQKALAANYANEQVEYRLPTVAALAEKLALSPKYLSDLLKAETGKTAQEHIHLFVVNEAKNLLKKPELNVSEVAYRLGFEYNSHFTKFFKSKTGMSPTAFLAGEN